MSDGWTPLERAVFSAITDETASPYMARSANYFTPGRDHDDALQAMKAADAGADADNLAFVRRIIAIATGKPDPGMGDRPKDWPDV